jgi:hypothetical protein
MLLKLTLELIMKIDKESFKQHILSGKTIKELQEIYGCSRGNIALHKKEYGFVGLSPNSKKREDTHIDTKICTLCNAIKPLSSFYSNGYTSKGTKKYKAKCSTCENSERTSGFRELVLKYLRSCDKDYSCAKCKYTGIWGSLDFHHVSPKDKLFSIGSANKTISEQKFEEEIVPEIDKCVLLCPNCHRQEHLLMGSK